eukprot:scaffold64676_cov26-Prasinocladus_malaysianus.AAC.1
MSCIVHSYYDPSEHCPLGPLQSEHPCKDTLLLLSLIINKLLVPIPHINHSIISRIRVSTGCPPGYNAASSVSSDTVLARSLRTQRIARKHCKGASKRFPRQQQLTRRAYESFSMYHAIRSLLPTASVGRATMQS